MTENQNEQVVNETAPAVESFANEQEVSAPVVPETALKKMLPVIIVAAVALIAIILGILLLGGNGDKYIMEKQDFIKGPEGNIYLDGKKVAQLDFETVYLYTGMDGKSAIAECRDEDDDGYTVYVVTKKGAVEIATDVSVTEYSRNNEYIVYYEETEDGSEQTYTWYNVSKKKGETLGEDLAAVALSADGKTVAYAKGEETDDAIEYTTFVKKWGGKAAAIELKNARPVMVSNGAKYLYLSKAGEEGKTALYRSVNKKEPVKVSGNGSFLAANLDGSEILFNDNDKGSTYWVKGKKEAVKIAKGLKDMVTPTGTIGYETFKNHVYLYGDSGSTLGYFDGKEIHKISSDVGGYSIAKDGKALYFTKRNNDGEYELNYVKNATAKKYEPAKVMEDVRSSVKISPDGKKAYVLTDDDELMVCNGKKKGKKIADDVANIHVVNAKGICYFTDEDGTFFASKNGKEKVNVADLSDEESTTRGLYGEYYYYEVEGDLFYITGTKGVKVK